MDRYEQFNEFLEIAAEQFKEIDRKETIRLISHIDADGIASASIFVKALNTDNRRYSLSTVKQLTLKVINELVAEPYKFYVFTDLGSGQLSMINKHLHSRRVFILDHHKPEEMAAGKNIVHVNPHLFGIDGSREVSGAGVVYLFARQLDKRIDDLAYVAIIGAIGDIQENNGFGKINQEILETAVRKGTIKVVKGLRIFGAQTRPLHKVLEYTTDPYIPGVSGSETGAIKFLQELGIKVRDDKGWRKIVHLGEDEIKRLVAGIVMKRMGEEKPEDVLGNVYILREEKKESPLRDAKEFATLLNACGRLDKASLGIGACLGDKRMKARAIAALQEYKREIINALQWFSSNKGTEKVIEGNGFLIINAKDEIMPTLAGTLASIISKGNGFKNGTFILSMADMLDGTTKVSLRIAGSKKRDLREVVKEICSKVGGESGGHERAAGAMIATEKDEEFVRTAKEILERKALEEFIG